MDSVSIKAHTVAIMRLNKSADAAIPGAGIYIAALLDRSLPQR